ncbi:hypothetical protein [Vibrio cholerae]|uniref:hypothetical protein n=1 Tax=Vibrio cholerae TaxID=666 RepID=UPI00115B3771|nr:hypothetical protein [Vibrio cholerae]TQP30186.1 hypothetical protein FLL92_19385 [Vibrio cholerae]TQQ22339.1 hypothetical protein FLL85_14155 [Vibrio cholerae]
MTSFTPVSSPIFPAGSSQPALDAQITKVSPSSSLLTNQPVNVMVNPSPISPNSAVPTDSILASNQDSDSSSERAETIETPEQKFNKKKINKKSNKYDNKSKAKVHLGACAVGSITLGILAGPLGLVFAAAYINAMCGVMYGGSEFYTGDKTNQAKKEPDPQPKDTPHKTPRNLNVPSSEEGKIPDETDAEREKEQDNKGKDNVFIFAPVINNDNRTTIHGNVYFFNQNDQKNDSSAEPKSSSNFSQTEKETNTTPTMRGARLINRQEARQLISHPSVLNATVENVDDIINQFHGAELIHVDFHDGMNAIVDAPESLRHQILLHQDETGAQTPTSASYNVQGVEDTGVTKNGPLQSNAPQHHRGGDFDALIGAEIAHSQASARLVADELQEKPVIGATGTHRWQQAEQGSWVLQPNNSVQAQTPSAMGGSPQSTPTNAPVSDGMDDTTDAQTVISTPNNMKRSDHTRIKDNPLAKAALHHRGADFDALIGAEIAHSQASARLVADELQEKPVIGATGTHRWQQAEQGSWVLQPNNSVQAQTPSAMGGSPQSTPTNAPVSDGMDDATDAQSPILTPDNVKRSDRTSADLKKVTNDRSTFDTENSHINLVPTTGQGGQIISEILPPVTPADLSKKISSSWTRVISEDGQVRWSNSFQSADQLVLLTAGSISGLGGNYTKGTWNNLRDIEEHRKNRLKNLQNNLSSKDYKKFNTLDGKLVWPLQEANLKTA